MPWVGDPSFSGDWELVFGVRERIICLAVWSYLVSELGNGTGGPGILKGVGTLAVRRTWWGAGGFAPWTLPRCVPGASSRWRLRSATLFVFLGI